MKKIIAIIGLACAALFVVGGMTGCGTVKSAVYDEVRTPTGEVKTGDGVLVSDLPAEIQQAALDQGYDMTDVIFLDEMDASTAAVIRADNPALVTQKTREYYTVEYKLKPITESLVQTTGAIPVPGANYIPIALTAVLGVLGTWLKGRQATKAQQTVATQDKIIKTFAIADDTLQNVVDQIAASNPTFAAKYYEIRDQVLKQGGTANQVLAEVLAIIEKNQTPTQILSAA
ncbi:MAG: hypothetical protein Q7Q73_06420 [Verrucomicrobiota bacterium JB024]|nr:hypothetical protein [Verrucomicrobiota bacterium JB024]